MNETGDRDKRDGGQGRKDGGQQDEEAAGTERGQVGGSPGRFQGGPRARAGRRGWKSPSLAWGLTGTSRGVPAGRVTLSVRQHRYGCSCFSGSWGCPGGHGRGSADAERAPPFPPFQGRGGGGGGKAGEGGGRGRLLRNGEKASSSPGPRASLARSGCAPRGFWPLAARGGRGRVSLGGPKKQLRKGRRPGDTRRGWRRAARAQATTVTFPRAPVSPAGRARGRAALGGAPPSPEGTRGWLQAGGCAGKEEDTTHKTCLL